MANTKISRTPSSASNRKTFTISLWFRIGRHPFTDSAGGTSREIIGQTSSSYFRCMLKSDSTMRIYDESGFNFITNRKFRDHSSFYHIVIRVDTTQSTANDRVRIYINGVDERTVGGYSTSTAPSQNQDFAWNTTSVHQIGGHSGNYDYFSGVMSHIHHCDGTSLAPTVFGSIDSTTGEWQINTSPTFTPGTNGFTILKDGNTITDQSANSNNFSLVSGTLTKTEDCPSNVFATMNPLQFNSSSETFSNGNNTLVSTGGGSWTTHYGFSTLAMGSGKYYVEMKADNTGTSGQSYPIGLIDVDKNIVSSLEDDGLASIRASNGNIVGSSFTNQTGLTAVSAGDILAIAYDGVNGTLQFYRNGSTHGTAITGIDTSKDYYVACDTYEGSSNFKYNFGNGYFGTTAVTTNSGNGYAGAEGASKFNYQPLTGYSALNTKGLNL